MSDSSEDSTDFLIKRAEYNARIAGLHSKSKEYGKAMTLYREAYTLLKKALQNHPDDTIIQKKTEEIKQLFEAARIGYQEQTQNAAPPQNIPDAAKTTVPPEDSSLSDAEPKETPVKKKGSKKKK